jgi:hypothetical protein
MRWFADHLLSIFRHGPLGYVATHFAAYRLSIFFMSARPTEQQRRPWHRFWGTLPTQLRRTLASTNVIESAFSIVT